MKQPKVRRGFAPIARHAPALRAALILAAILASESVASTPADAQTLTVLYSFTGKADGQNPVAGLVRDSSGNLYGTTGCNYCSPGHGGSVFEVDTSGEEITLYSFTGDVDGKYPDGSLLLDSAGNLYGTTSQGGTHGGGTAFKLDNQRQFTVLHDFAGYPNDGSTPLAGLISDSSGDLYGTTFSGGASRLGAAFELDPAGTLTLLHSFGTGTGDGIYPGAALVRDAAGNLYGTTFEGGADGGGIVFKLDTSGVETVLHTFGKFGNPQAPLIEDAAGYLYGTAYGGGSTLCISGCGTVFRVNSTTEKGGVLYRFGAPPDGSNPVSSLVRDAAGNVYGTTFHGGAYGGGIVFKLDKTGGETVLYTFTGGMDGGNPEAGLVMDAEGNLYGTTYLGGDLTCFPPYGCGTVFKLTP